MDPRVHEGRYDAVRWEPPFPLMVHAALASWDMACVRYRGRMVQWVPWFPQVRHPHPLAQGLGRVAKMKAATDSPQTDGACLRCWTFSARKASFASGWRVDDGFAHIRGRLCSVCFVYPPPPPAPMAQGKFVRWCQGKLDVELDRGAVRQIDTMN